MEEMNNKSAGEIRFGDLFDVLKRCWWLMLVVAIVVGAASYAFMRVTHKDEYTATATIWAIGSNANTSDNVGKTSAADVQIAMYLIKDYKELILTPNVMKDALINADSDMSVSALRANTSITNNEDSHVMHVSVTASDPEEARDIVNSLSDEFCRRINDKNDEERPLVSVWDRATAPASISNPISLFLVAVFALLGAVIVFIVFVVIRLMDDRINTTEDVERYLGLNLLGVIPNRDDARRRSLRRKTYYTSYSKGQHAE